MPTAAKLTGALCFGVLGYAIYVAMLMALGDDLPPSNLLIICVGAGLIVGWHLCGRNAVDLWSGIANGLSAVVSMGLLVVALISVVRMIELSLKDRYDSPADALINAVAMMTQNAVKFATLEIGLLLLIGGLLGGGLTGLVGRWIAR